MIIAKKVRLVGGYVVAHFLQWGISDWDSSLKHFPVRGYRARSFTALQHGIIHLCQHLYQYGRQKGSLDRGYLHVTVDNHCWKPYTG